MAKANVNWMMVAAIGVLAYFLIYGMPGTTTPPPVTPPPSGGSTEGCNVEDISFSPQMTRLGKAGTSIGAADGYYIITDNLGLTRAGTSTTVPTNYEMTVMFGENSSTYYTVVETLNTGCSDPRYAAVKLPQADTSLSQFYIHNSNGQVNTATQNETFDADDVLEVTVYYKASVDQYFGNPTSTCNNIGLVEYNQSSILRAYNELDSADTPGFFRFRTTNYTGSSAFVIPKSADGELVQFSLSMDSHGSRNPNPQCMKGGTSACEHTIPRLHIFDCDVDKDEDDLSLIHGIEDEDDNMISLANTTSYIYIT